MGQAVDIKAIAAVSPQGNKDLIMHNIAINLTALNKMALIDYSPYSIINKDVYKWLNWAMAIAISPSGTGPGTTS